VHADRASLKQSTECSYCPSRTDRMSYGYVIPKLKKSLIKYVVIPVVKDMLFTEQSSPFLKIRVNYSYQFCVLTAVGH
jgi:hypothetical protein